MKEYAIRNMTPGMQESTTVTATSWKAAVRQVLQADLTDVTAQRQLRIGRAHGMVFGVAW